MRDVLTRHDDVRKTRAKYDGRCECYADEKKSNDKRCGVSRILHFYCQRSLHSPNVWAEEAS